MADIDIVHKKRTSVWLWVALAIVALVVLFLLFGMFAEPQVAQSFDGASRVPQVAGSTLPTPFA